MANKHQLQVADRLLRSLMKNEEAMFGGKVGIPFHSFI
jgi:hypothetical protein